MDKVRRDGSRSLWTVLACVGFLVLTGNPAAEAGDVIRGTATYRERIALPPGAVLEVTLEDVSAAHAPAVVVARTLVTKLAGPPFAFELPYRASDIDAGDTYAVRAQLMVDGRAMFATAAAVPVLTHGAGREVELLLRRSPHGASRTASGPLGELPATFAGDLPCGDCEGLRTQLDLFADGSFFKRTISLGRDHGAVSDAIGTWTLSDDGSTLTLFGGERPDSFRVIDRSTLRKLDREGHEIASPLNYSLERTATFAALEPHLEMQGMFRYLADAGSFEECLTGRRFPVAQQGDNAALEQAYLAARREPGEPLLVSLVGHIASRPAMEGDAQVLAVVPERFLAVSPGESCETRTSVSALEGTRWVLTGVGDRPVVVAEGQREPFLVLDVDGERATGFGGCNRFMGSYSRDGLSLTFGVMASTMMACAEGEGTEHALLAALDKVASWRVLDHRLELLDGTGQVLARFESRDLE